MLFEELCSSRVKNISNACSQALKLGDFIFISQQRSDNPNGNFRAQTLDCLDHMQFILEECGIDLSYLLKITVFLKDISRLKEFEEVYCTKMNHPLPARSVIVVKDIEDGADIAIDGYALDTRALEVLCANDHGCECDESVCSL